MRPTIVAASRPSARRTAGQSVRSLLAAGAAAAILLGAGWGQRVLDARVETALQRVAPLQQPLASLPLEIGGWRGVDVPLDEGAQEAAHFDDQFVNRVYSGPAGGPVGVFVGYVGRARARLGHRPDVCYTGVGWERQGQEAVRIEAAGRTAPATFYEFRAVNDPAARLCVLATYVINGRFVEDPTDFQRYNARGANLLGERPAYLARVQATALGTHDRGADVALLQTFIAALAEPLAELLPYWEP